MRSTCSTGFDSSPESASPGTGARISEALALRLMDVRRDRLVLPNLKNPSRLTKRVFLPAGQMDLPGGLLLWAKAHGLADGEPLFFSRKRAKGGGPHAISRQQASMYGRAGWSRLQMAYLSVSDDEVRDAMLAVAD